MYFAEFNATAAGQRVFDIKINDLTVARDIDVFKLSGGRNKALSISVPFNSAARSTFDIGLPTQVCFLSDTSAS